VRPSDQRVQARSGLRRGGRDQETDVVGPQAVTGQRLPDRLLPRWRQETFLRLALLEHKRSAVIALRDGHRIDDAVLLRVQEQLDAEEVRLAQVSQDQ
jgi:hypothetical protein